MMKNTKKLVAAISIVALLAINFANTNAASPTASISGDTITLLTTGTSSSDTISVVVKKDGVNVDPADYTVNSSTNGTITVTANVSGDFDDSNLEVSYISEDGDNGAVVVNNIAAGETGSHTVTVSAYVLPILSMSLSSSTIDFGELVPDSANTKTTNVTTASNAKGGITVSVASTGLATGNSANDKYIGALNRGSATATTAANDLYQISSSTNNGGDVLNTTDVASSQQILVASNVSEANATTTVSLSATARATTEAGNYNDTLTFTVTGTF